MGKIKCISVKLESLVSISDKAYLARSFDGREDVIPKSQVFGDDWEVTKCSAYWISAWIMSKKDLQYSGKKVAWFNSDTGRIEPNIEIVKHVPEKIEIINVEPNKNLIR